MRDFKWLTVVSPEGAAAVELLLEPTHFPPAKDYQKALFDAGIPLTSFGIGDVRKEFERLQTLGVFFRLEPTQMGPVTMATFDLRGRSGAWLGYDTQMGPVTMAAFEDTRGNLIQIAQQ